MSYQPKPIDTSEVVLKEYEQQLIELLAHNTHEIWSQQRISQGWKYGPQRNDVLKEHPGLIPYEQLSEVEKQYDRETAMGVVKTLVVLGYRLEKNENALSIVEQNGQELALRLKILRDSSELNLASIVALQRETIRIKPTKPEIYQVLTETMIQLGEPLMAYDLITEGLKQWDNDRRLKQLLALALARSGASERANMILRELVNAGLSDEETISLLARTHKDLYLKTSDPEQKKHQLSLAAQRYTQAYQLSGGYYSGINAATMAMLSGDQETAFRIARQVQNLCLDKLEQQENYWLLATLAEATLILGLESQAHELYEKAVQIGKGRFGDLSSTWRNAKLVAEYLHFDTEGLKKCFEIPKVVLFSGHMIDGPQRSTPRFPPELEGRVYEAIRDRLSQLDGRLGYASAASGSDILFLEAIKELLGEIHIILPYEQEQFIKDAVDIIPGSNWRKRFERLISEANDVIIASPRKLEQSEVLYEYADRLLHGLAKMRTSQLDTEMITLAVWDEDSSQTSGTTKKIQKWRQWGNNVEFIDLDSLLKSSVTIQKLPKKDKEHHNPADRQIMAILFGDVVNYSQLQEEEIPAFIEEFLGAVVKLESQGKYTPRIKSSWGDCLYYVFSHVQEAGNFALELSELVQNTDWAKKGLPKGLNLRISLHAGPVYRYINPLSKEVSYIGSHVTYGARIEPITPPGKVYASRAFAAFSASEGVRDFSCDYVGQTRLAKGYGTFPTYHVQRL